MNRTEIQTRNIFKKIYGVDVVMFATSERRWNEATMYFNEGSE